MNKIAHIINPVIVPTSSDLYNAQPITFESIRAARENIAGQVDVSLFSAQFEEDISLIPSFFTKTPHLGRSILDFGSFKKPKKLPLMKDILDRLVQNTDADYLIYSNVDIAVQPNFYTEVNKIIDEGYETFVINRRTISADYKSVEELALMYDECGKPHPGYDCFIFKRKIYNKFHLGKIVIGTNLIGLSLITNLISYSQKMKIFEDLHLTFHIGEERSWLDSIYDDYIQFNLEEYSSLSKAISMDIGRLTKYIKHFRTLKIRNFVKVFKHI